MTKQKRNILTVAVMFMFILVGSSIVNAASFNITATKLLDGETAHINKIAGYHAGSATVSTMSATGKSYHMWIEKGSTGTNISTAKEFSAPCSGTLIYDRPVHVTEGYAAKLNISTTPTTFATCTFTGSWTPNSY